MNKMTKPKKYLLVINFILLLCVLVLCVPFIQSFAYTFNGYILNTNYVLTFVPYSGFTDATRIGMVQSVNSWNSASGLSLMAISPSSHNNSSGYPSNDDQSYIYKETNYSYSGVGVTHYYHNSWPHENVLRSVDILINTRYAFYNGQKADRYDTWSVFVHEAGHAAGMSHTNLSDNTIVMYTSISMNTLRRTLKTDDHLGITALYS